MKKQILVVLVLALSASGMKLSWNDIRRAAGINFVSNSSTWSGGSGMGSNYSLVKHSSMINGNGAHDLLAIYLKQLIVLLSNTDNEIRVVRLEVDSTAENYKVLIRIKDCHGNKVYIGMLVYVCNGEIKINKFFQSDSVDDIIKAFCFLDGTLYNYPDGNIGNQCSNSILAMLSNFCSAIGGGGANWSNQSNWNSNGGLAPLNGNSTWLNSSGSGNGIGSDGVKLHIKIPGAQNPTGKTILLGASKPQ